MLMHRGDQALAIRALRSAAPYIRMYKGKTFVVKAGGGVFANTESTRILIEQIAILHYFGVRVIMVHGGGPQLTELSDALGVPTRMVEGRRVTDAKSIDVTSMVLNGLINTRILGICRELNIDAVGISGVDAGLVRAHKRPPVKAGGSGELVDYGFVGDIDQVDTTVLKKLLDNGLMPVVSPLSADDSGMLLNINADTVAAAIGAALAAEKLILTCGACSACGRKAGSATGCCQRRNRSRQRSAAACGAFTWSPTRLRKESWARCSRTKAPARSSWRTSMHLATQSSRARRPHDTALGQGRAARRPGPPLYGRRGLCPG
jgi:acetylglutamate kinase